MTIVFDALAEHGRRVVSHYTIAGCEREGEPLDVICRHRRTHDAQVLPMSIHEALGTYLKAHPVIAPKREGREIVRNPAQRGHRFQRKADSIPVIADSK